MSETNPPPLPPCHSDSGALAIASFALGLISFFTGFIVVGGLAGVVGLVLGIIHLVRHPTHRAFARWGVGLSVAGMIVSATVPVLAWVYVVKPFLANFSEGEESFDSTSWIGKPVPEMTLTTLDGRAIRSADWRGHPVVLDMWASWHPACTGAVPDFTRLATETASQGVVVVAVTSEDPADLGEFATNRMLGFSMVSATNLPPPFSEVESIPTTFFINAEGLIRDIRVGYDGYEALKQAALDRSPPAVPQPLTAEETNP